MCHHRGFDHSRRFELDRIGSKTVEEANAAAEKHGNPKLAADLRSQAKRAFARLERGLADYGVKKR